jgi:predicted RND superfamily exporter protein
LRKNGLDTQTAISQALESSGKAVMLTSLILILGFGIMMFGSFIPYIYVGLFSAMIIFLALIADLFFLPALLFLTDKKEAKLDETEISNGEIQNA